MSFTAYVAFKDSSGTYDLHKSQNGGYHYMLRPILEEYIEGNKNRSASDIPEKFTIPEEARELARSSAHTSVEQLTEENVISPDPREINLAKENIAANIPAYDVEALYVVEDNNVETFIPVNATPLGIKRLQDAARIGMYKFREDEHPMDAMQNSSRNPDAVFSGEDYLPNNYDNNPNWAIKTLEQGHRYFNAQLSPLLQKMQAANQQLESHIILSGVGVAIQIRNPKGLTGHLNIAVPVKVFFDRNGDPSYPPQTESIEQIGAEPKAWTSEQRFKIHEHLITNLQQANNDNEEEISEVAAAHTDQILKNIGEKYDTGIEFSLVTEEIETRIKDLVRQQSNPVTDELPYW